MTLIVESKGPQNPKSRKKSSDALVSSIDFKQVGDASTAPRALVLISLGKKTVRMGVMANMLAVWSLSCRLLLPMNEVTLVRELVLG